MFTDQKWKSAAILLGIHLKINSKVSFISTITQVGWYILLLLLHQLLITGWNKEELNESTKRDQFDDPLHRE